MRIPTDGRASMVTRSGSPTATLSFDIFWVEDNSLMDSDNLPRTAVLGEEIVDDLGAALDQFRSMAGDLGRSPDSADT